MKKQYFLTLLFLGLGLMACQSDDRQNTTTETHIPTIRGNLFVRYIENDNHIKAEAYFFEGTDDTDTKPKRFSRGVKFLGSGMGERQMGDRYYKYQYENTTAWQENYFFSLTDDNDKEYRFEFNPGTKPLEDFELPSYLEKQKTNYINFSPAQLPENSYVAVLLTDSNNKAATTKITGPSKEGRIIIEPDLLNKLQSGEAEAYLVHVQTKRIEQPPFSVAFTLEYYSPIKKTVIK